MLEQEWHRKMTSVPVSGVLVYGACDKAALSSLLDPYGLRVDLVKDEKPIAGSYWGDSEAGLIDDRLLVRSDTPVHSILHEACHFICMDRNRRGELHTDAGGDYDEENAVCFLQILLAGKLSEMGQNRMLADMDLWGYTFRLGSAGAWFEQDSEQAKQWLIQNNIIDEFSRLSGQLRN